MCLASVIGIFAILADAALRADDLELDRREIDCWPFPSSAAELNQSPPCLTLSSFNHPSGFCPFPLVVLCATLNHEPPSFFVARSRASAFPTVTVAPAHSACARRKFSRSASIVSLRITAPVPH